MNKNNFFVKFAYWYKFLFSLMKKNIWIICKLLAGICVNVVVLIVELLSCVLPVLQIHKAIITRFYTDEELAKKGYTLEAGYYYKNIKERERGG